jgi:hypothetical protein
MGTPGTRHGAGSGWGGPAKGFVRKPPRAFTAADAAETGVNVAATNHDLEAQAYRQKQWSKARLRRERMEQLADAAVVVLGQILKDEKHLRRFEAAREALNRVDGMPGRTDSDNSEGSSALTIRVIGGLPDASAPQR